MKRFLAIVSLLLLTLTATAQDTVVSHRPKVGLVLSGGGAKGFSHIGALKVIEEAGIPIDYIGGTSMGSIVGGLYAVGYDVPMLEKITVEQNWDRILKDEIPRKFLPLEKRLNERHYLMTFPYKNGQLKVKRSFADGVYVNMLLTRLTMPAYQKRNFDELPIPFLCIGTDMLSSDAIEFRSGSLAQAIRSSMSIPFLFEPIDYDGKLLCDGGLKNNFPVQNVRDMGADIIIGVDLEIASSDPNQLDNSLKVLERLIAVVAQDESNRARKDCDILILPDVGNVNMLSFNDFGPILESGEVAAREKYPELKKLADSLQAIEPFEVQRFHTQPIDLIYVADIAVEGVDERDQELIKSEFGDEFPRAMLFEEIETIIVKIYSQGYYSNVWYELVDTPEGNILKFHCKNKTSLTFSVGAHYDNNYGIGVLLNMSAKTKHFLYNVDLNVADNPYFKARISHRYSKMWSGNAEITAMNLKANLYYPTGSIGGALRLQQNALDLYLQLVPTVTQSIRLGFNANYTMLKDMLYYELDDEDTYKHEFWPRFYLHYFFNNQDHIDYPRQGWNVNFIGKCIMYDGVFSSSNLQPMFTVQADVNKSFPVGDRHAFRVGAVGASSLGDMKLINTTLMYDKPVINYNDLFFIGGQSKMRYVDNFMSFTGLPFMSIYTQHAAFAKTAWQWNFYKNFYGIVSCDAGYFRNLLTMEDIDDLIAEILGDGYKNWFVPDKYVMGAGLTLGYKTMLGPIEVEVSKSNVIDSWVLFVNFGFWF